MAERYEDPHPGDGLVNLAFAGTGALVGTSLAGSLLPDTFGIVHAILAGLLFVVGTGALLWAYALGVSRSRAVVVTLAGLFFLAGGAAPPDTRQRFRVALAVQVVAVVAAAAIRPFTEVAFGILAPMFGLGLMAMWGGRYGLFAAKEADHRGASRS
ncbi:MAG: hypothetical protein Q8K58_05475 [Acidimicrobiales bacterium]|nr:hypothetical protein [Acidimicrobiales bacterium]